MRESVLAGYGVGIDAGQRRRRAWDGGLRQSRVSLYSAAVRLV